MIGAFLDERGAHLEAGPVFAGRRWKLFSIRCEVDHKLWGEWGIAFSWETLRHGPTLWLFYGLGCRPVSLLPRFLRGKGA